MSSLHEFHAMGQSTWLNMMRRAFVQSGELRQEIENGIEGVTANASLYEQTLLACADYDTAVRQAMAAGTPARHIHEMLMIDDVQRAADLLHPVYHASDHLDGFVSLELDPAVCQDPVSTVAEVRHLLHKVDRANAMVEVPATPAGIEAIKTLIADGECVNITHIFDPETFEQVAEAYLTGIEQLFATNSAWRITPTAVASFSLSPIDQVVDPLLRARGAPQLTGKTAVAMAVLVYNRFRERFSGPRWEKLERRGARPLRPKWTRVQPVDFRLPATAYIEELILPDTIVTFTPATLTAVADLDLSDLAPVADPVLAGRHLDRVAALGIDLPAVTRQLQADYLIRSDNQFQALMQAVIVKRDMLERRRPALELFAGDYAARSEATLESIRTTRVMRRIWARDMTLWPAPDAEGPGLGWLDLPLLMPAHVEQINVAAEDLFADGYTQALLIGEAAVCRNADLFQGLFGRPLHSTPLPYPYLLVDTTTAVDDIVVNAHLQELDPGRSVIILVDKGRGTEQVLNAFEVCRERLMEELDTDEIGAYFIAVASPGSPLLELAAAHRFRAVFIDSPHADGRFAPLSIAGLLPAALVGANVDAIVQRARAAAVNTSSCDITVLHDNRAARLGALLAALAHNRQAEITLLPSLQLLAFATWLTPFLNHALGGAPHVAVASTVAEPELYASNRLFVHLRMAGDRRRDATLQALREAGLPVVVLHWRELEDVGGNLMLWQMTTAVAAHLLQRYPFQLPAPLTV